MSNAAPNTAGAPWAQAPEAAGDEAAGFTIFGIDLARVAKVPLRRWPLTLLAILVSAGVAYVCYSKLKKDQWLINAKLEYRPLQLPVQRQGSYTPQSFETVLVRMSDRTNFDKLLPEFGIYGLDTYQLANNIFKIARGGTGSEANIITISVDWEDREEGVKIVKRLIEICQQRQLWERVELLKNSYKNQKAAVERKRAEVDKAKEALADYLKEHKFKDQATLTAAVGQLNARVADLKAFIGTRERELEGVADNIDLTQKKITDQKEAKGPPDPADEEQLKERRRELEDRIRTATNNVKRAEADLIKAQEDYKKTQKLEALGSRSKDEVKESARQVTLASQNLQASQGELEGLNTRLKELKAGTTKVQLLQGRLSELKMQRDTAELALKRAKKELDSIREDAARALEVSEGAKQLQETTGQAQKGWQEEVNVLEQLATLRDNDFPELQINDEAKSRSWPSSSTGKKMAILGFSIPFAVFLALLIGFEMMTTGWKAESLAENMKLPLLARSSGSRRAGGLSPTEARGLSLRIRQYVPDAGGIVLLSSLNDGPGIDRLVSDLSRYFAARDEKVLVLDARIANTEGDQLPRLLGRQVVRGAVEVVPDGESTMRGKVGTVVVSGLVQYLVFEGMDPAGFICPTRIPAVDYMAAGGPYALTDVLASQPMKDLFDTLRRRYSLILVVGPSVTKSIDTEILAAYVSGIVFIINSPIKTATPAVQEFLLSLKEANAPLLGSVVCV
jgi:Mrp family chromosome partitioning ATPase